MGVEIKGQRDGFYIVIDEKLPFLEAREKLIQKLEDANNFFKGARFFRIEAPNLKKADIKYLQDLISESYAIQFIEEGSESEKEKNSKRPSLKQERRVIDDAEDFSISAKKMNERLSAFDETLGKIRKITENNKEDIATKQNIDVEDTNLKTKFVFENMRSGAEIDYEGNVIVFGDVNPGAKIVAKGNIIVLGSFRGMAHAGRNNSQECFVAALKLLPLQIRIHDVFAVPPQDAKMIENAMVLVKNGEIEIEQF